MLLKLDKDFALFYGIMLGDGCLSEYLNRGYKMRIIAITGSSLDDLPFFKEVISPLLKKFRNKESKIKFRKNANTIDFNFQDKELFDFIHAQGFPVGKKRTKLFIPKVFYDKGLVEYVIQGFFATDGSLVITKNNNTFYPRVEANGIAKRLIKEINDYICSRGINSHLYHAKRKQSFGFGSSNQDRVQINGIKNSILFNKIIGLVNPKHNRKFNKILAYYKEYKYQTKGVHSHKVRPIYEKLNKDFEIIMSRERFELSASGL